MSVSKLYLITYNLSQVFGWAYLMTRLWPYLALQAQKGLLAGNPPSLYSELGFHVRLVQTAAVLEIVHAFIGLVRSNPMVTATQIFSRLAVVWLPIHNIANSQQSSGITLMLFAWCLTEIIRYSYYALNLVNINLSILTWLRYTLFIVLYPMGVTGEMWCYFDSLSYLKSSKWMRIDLPNTYNFTFSPYILTILILFLYLPGFPPLYFHMFAQRKKVLQQSKPKEA